MYTPMLVKHVSIATYLLLGYALSEIIFYYALGGFIAGAVAAYYFKYYGT